MTKDIISFNIGNKKFAVDILKTPLILSAIKYLPRNYNHNQNDKYFQFERKNVKIVDLHSILSVNFNSLSKHSKILVGYFNKGTYGLLVDSVDEVINLNDSIKESSGLKPFNDSNFIDQILDLSEEKLLLLDVDKIINHSHLQEMEIR